MRIFRALVTALVMAFAAWAQAGEMVSHPFVGVTCIAREEKAPRPLRMHVVDIDLAAPSIRFRLTPHSGPLHTVKQTTLAYLKDQQAQIAVNAHFFEPWPAPSPDPGTATLVGIAASDGQVYAPFLHKPPKPYAIQPNAPGLNIGADNRASIVHRSAAAATGLAAAEPVTLYNTLAGDEQIVTGGRVSAVASEWNGRLAPRTAIGLTGRGHLILFVVDGRQPGISEGMSVPEVARMLAADYAVVDALDLDGGGSATLAIADPMPRVVNVPVGIGDVPGTERAVGSNLAVFAQRPESTSMAFSTSAPATPPCGIAAAPWLAVALAVCLAAGLVVLAWRRRSSRAR